jgi:hypothetical protein
LFAVLLSYDSIVFMSDASADTYPAFVLDDQPEVFASTAATSLAVRRAVQAGRARRIGRGLFTRNTVEPLESVVARNWTAIASLYVPGGVVVDRSAFDAKPSEDGSLMLDGGPSLKARRTYELPGLRLRVRPGPGPLPGDMPHMEGLFLSSRPRAWLENMVPSRARGGASRTLSKAELERELNRVVAVRGWEAVNDLRDSARELAPQMAAQNQFAELDDLIGALQGTHDTPLVTRAGKLAGRGGAFDPARLELFETLHAALMVEQLPARPEQADSLPALSFFEAYFSNWIEGTEFELDEAEAIVFEREIPPERVEDAHDVLGTFDLVNDDVSRRRLPKDADDFVALLRSHHEVMLERRPSARPGRFKEKPNRAGSTTFVHPDLAAGTLREGFRFIDSLPDGLARAIFFMFLISEVHPFTDGNGRVARVFMNAALTASGLQRIVIPLVYRDNYLTSLRALTLHGNPTPLIRVLDYGQRYGALIPWGTVEGATEVLRDTNAFVTPDEAERTNARLKLPIPAQTPAPTFTARSADLDRWAGEHLDDLSTIWGRFKQAGEWPDAGRLARELFGAGRDFDPTRFGQSIPPQLGRLDPSTGTLMLTPRGLSYLGDARPLLAHFPKLVRIAIERYGDPEVEPLISSGEFARLLDVSDLEARQLSELLLLDGWLLRAFGNDEQDRQQFQIDPAVILRVRDVNTLEDYFRSQDHIG